MARKNFPFYSAYKVVAGAKSAVVEASSSWGAALKAAAMWGVKAYDVKVLLA